MDFLRNNRLFSLRLDGVDAFAREHTVTVSEKKNERVTVYTFPDGLRITNTARRHEPYGAYEWVNRIENLSDRETALITDFWDCAVELPLEHEDNAVHTAYQADTRTATKIHAPCGSVWAKKEFYCDPDAFERADRRKYHIVPGETKDFYNVGGRSSDGIAPFFNVQKNDGGYIFAIGWSGQWHCQVARGNDSVSLRTQIDSVSLRLLPGESYRTSSVVILPYENGLDEAHNTWRRLVRERFSLLGQPGRPDHGPLCAGIWGGMEDSAVLERIRRIQQAQLPIEYIWMDAGWYGADTQPTRNEFEGDWGMHTGDWQVSPHIHPDGLLSISSAVHEAGMKFLLWFEPERVVHTTPIAVEHPEFVLEGGYENDMNRLLDLGNPDAWRYCYDILADYIERLEIDCLRIDFNVEPLNYWRYNDTEGRKGIHEIRYINGLYALWDALLERFPHLWIDDCASGGRRIDIETLRRSMPLWRSDFQCAANFQPEGSQCHSLTFNRWMPYSGTGTGRPLDEYRYRSAYGASMTINAFYAQNDDRGATEEQLAFIRKYTEEYRRVRPYFSEDFYPLSAVSEAPDSWCMLQFDRPEQKDGLLQVFRREQSPYETACISLKAIDREATYCFTDLDGGEFTVPGRQLAEDGLRLTVPERRKAKLYIYRKVQA